MTMLEKTFEPKAAEPRIYAQWEESGLFAPRAAQPTDGAADAYSIVIPPPNVTGSLHIGHALNNTLQDILARYHRMKGKAVLWLPGTDHAGIATQMVVERQLAADGVGRHDLGAEPAPPIPIDPARRDSDRVSMSRAAARQVRDHLIPAAHRWPEPGGAIPVMREREAGQVTGDLIEIYHHIAGAISVQHIGGLARAWRPSHQRQGNSGATDPIGPILERCPLLALLVPVVAGRAQALQVARIEEQRPLASMRADVVCHQVRAFADGAAPNAGEERSRQAVPAQPLPFRRLVPLAPGHHLIPPLQPIRAGADGCHPRR